MENSTRGRDVERPASRASLDPPKRLSSRQAQVSRGRQPGEASTPPRAGNRGATRSTNRSRLSIGGEPIDISQFRAIEVHTAAHCPVHGSRSNSVANDHAVDGQEGPLPDDLPLGSPPVRRVHISDLAANEVEQPLQPLARPFPNINSRETGKKSDHVTTVDTSRSTTSSPFSVFEPKTPKAMKLVFDLKSAPLVEETIKCVELIGPKISRPRSAVW